MRKIYKKVLQRWKAILFSGFLFCILCMYITTNTSEYQTISASKSYVLTNLEVKHMDVKITNASKIKQACVHPTLTKWKDFDESSIKKNEIANCGTEKDWIYTGNGKFYISSSAVKRHGEINCTYTPIVNSNDNFKRLKPVYPMLNNSELLTDAFEVLCKSANGKTYSNIHACASHKHSAKSNMNTSPNDRYNVIMLGLDSLSRPMFQRVLPKTHEYFTKFLGGSLLEGYNAVGDGTTFAMMPLLSGKREIEIPEVRRGYPGAKPVDQYLDFIWKKYERQGYFTQWAEDWTRLGAFHYRLLGFKDQPVTHYMRPFYLAVQPYERKGHCIGHRSTYKVYLDWFREAIETHKGENFFIVGFSANYTHAQYNQMSSVDKYTTDFLKYLQKDNKLENTFLILMSDHGRRFGKFRMTEQGKLEERLPYFGLYVPPKYRAMFPGKYKTFLENKKRLTVPSDVHETFLEIIDEKSDLSKLNRSVYSLFSPIPLDRTCTDAKIEAHWCACQKSETISVSDPKLERSVQKVLTYFNSLLQDHLSLCHKLSIKNIIRAVSLQTDDKVLKFKSSWNRIPVFSDKVSTNKLIHYQVTFETDPGSGVFEVSYTMNTETDVINIDVGSISRLNRYNDAPKCIEQSHPGLRIFCYCRS